MSPLFIITSNYKLAKCPLAGERVRAAVSPYDSYLAIKRDKLLAHRHLSLPCLPSLSSTFNKSLLGMSTWFLFWIWQILRYIRKKLNVRQAKKF